MSLDKPTHPGLWWFKGTFRGNPFEGPVEYEGEGEPSSATAYPIQIMCCDDIFELKLFVGQYWPLDHDVVTRGNTEWRSNLMRSSRFRKCGPKPA